MEVAITYVMQLGTDVDIAPLATLSRVALIAASHPLAREGKGKLSQPAPLPMVLLDMPMSREYFLALFIRERVERNIVWSSVQVDRVQSLAANGIGYLAAIGASGKRKRR